MEGEVGFGEYGGLVADKGGVSSGGVGKEVEKGEEEAVASGAMGERIGEVKDVWKGNTCSSEITSLEMKMELVSKFNNL